MAREQKSPEEIKIAYNNFLTRLSAQKEMLFNALPSSLKNADGLARFETALRAAVASNKALLDCSIESLVRASITAAQLDLSLNPVLREADIIPRKGAAMFEPRYGGLLKLIRRSGDVLKVEAQVVYEHDDFEYSLGMSPSLTHKPYTKGPRGSLVAAYCVWYLKNGASQFEVMLKEEVDNIKARATKYKEKETPWDTDPAEMWRKTVIKRAAKYMPLSLDAAQAIAEDNEVNGFDVTPEPEKPRAVSQIKELEHLVSVDEEESTMVIPEAEVQVVDTPDTPELPANRPLDLADWGKWAATAIEELKAVKDADVRAAWAEENKKTLAGLAFAAPQEYKKINSLLTKH